MAMVDDHTEYEKITVCCKNCDNYIAFFFKPKGQPLIGNWYCNLKCISDHETKQRKAKENLTEQTLK